MPAQSTGPGQAPCCATWGAASETAGLALKPWHTGTSQGLHTNTPPTPSSVVAAAGHAGLIDPSQESPTAWLSSMAALLLWLLEKKRKRSPPVHTGISGGAQDRGSANTTGRTGRPKGYLAHQSKARRGCYRPPNSKHRQGMWVQSALIQTGREPCTHTGLLETLLFPNSQGPSAPGNAASGPAQRCPAAFTLAMGPSR